MTRLGEVLGLLGRLGSEDPATRRTAEAQLADLQHEIEQGPSPGEVLGHRVAEILREEADRLRTSWPASRIT